MLPLISRIICKDEFDHYYQINFKVGHVHMQHVFQESNQNNAKSLYLPFTDDVQFDESFDSESVDTLSCHKLWRCNKADTQDHLSSNNAFHTYQDTLHIEDDMGHLHEDNIIKRVAKKCQLMRCNSILKNPSTKNQRDCISLKGRSIQASDNHIQQNDQYFGRANAEACFHCALEYGTCISQMENLNNSNPLLSPPIRKSSFKSGFPMAVKETTFLKKAESHSIINSNNTSNQSTEKTFIINIPDYCKLASISIKPLDMMNQDEDVHRSLTSQMSQRSFDSMEESLSGHKEINYNKATMKKEFDERFISIYHRQNQPDKIQESHSSGRNINHITMPETKYAKHKSLIAENHKNVNINISSNDLNSNAIIPQDFEDEFTCDSGYNFMRRHESPPCKQHSNAGIQTGKNIFDIELRNRLLILSEEISKCLKNLADIYNGESDEWEVNENNGNDDTADVESQTHESFCSISPLPISKDHGLKTIWTEKTTRSTLTTESNNEQKINKKRFSWKLPDDVYINQTESSEEPVINENWDETDFSNCLSVDASVQANGSPQIGVIRNKGNSDPISRPEKMPQRSLIKFEYSEFLVHFSLPVMHIKSLKYKKLSSATSSIQSNTEISSSDEYSSLGNALVRLDDSVYQVDFQLLEVRLLPFFSKMSRGTRTNDEDWVYVKKKTVRNNERELLIQVPKSTYVYEGPNTRMRKNSIAKRQMNKNSKYDRRKTFQPKLKTISKLENSENSNLEFDIASNVCIENDDISAEFCGHEGVIEVLRFKREDMTPTKDIKIFNKIIGYHGNSVAFV